MAEKEKSKPSPLKHIPKDGQVIMSIMKEMGINEYESKTVVQLCEFVYRYATAILDEARMYAHSKKKAIDVDDVRLALELTNESSFTVPPPRELILECAHIKNFTPLQAVKPHCGIRLPPDRYCLSAVNFRVKSGGLQERKRVHRNALTGATTGITIKAKNNVSYIKRTPAINVTKQNVSIAKQPQKTIIKPKINITSNIESISSMQLNVENMEMDNGLKRKREDDDEGI